MYRIAWGVALPAQIRVGGYRIIRKLAVGGMAEIFLAQLEARHGFTKQVVIKRMLKIGFTYFQGIGEGRDYYIRLHPELLGGAA